MRQELHCADDLVDIVMVSPKEILLQSHICPVTGHLHRHGVGWIRVCGVSEVLDRFAVASEEVCLGDGGCEEHAWLKEDKVLSKPRDSAN